MNSLLYQIALTLIPNVGPIGARNLVSYCGSVEKIFNTSFDKLTHVPGVGDVIAKSIHSFKDFKRAEEEIKFIEKHNIQTFFFTDDEYPTRLKNINDSPILLFYKGKNSLNHDRIIAVVGTRKATDYGKNLTDKFISDIKQYNPIIISGLAYGIDIQAHKSALQNQLETIGVLGHGLHTIYPSNHRNVATKMVEQGGLLTEFLSNSDFDKENFPKRNRIVAGLCDCLIIVESAISGGALITAHLADDYNKDVFAFPGRVGDTASEGCNAFIKLNKASLIEGADDVARLMGWQDSNIKKIPQREIIFEYTSEEKPIVEKLLHNEVLDIDSLTNQLSLSPGQIATALLGLELKGAVVSLPGKRYKLI
jgi:DNA processing protein